MDEEGSFIDFIASVTFGADESIIGFLLSCLRRSMVSLVVSANSDIAKWSFPHFAIVELYTPIHHLIGDELLRTPIWANTICLKIFVKSHAVCC